jgi:hypothetical protein
MRLRETRLERRDGVVRLVAVVEHRGAHLEPFFAYPEAFEAFVVESADPFVPALLVPALHAGEPLEIDPPVSRLLLSRLPRVQDIYLSWFPPPAHPFRRIEVAARPREGPAGPPAAGVGAFFSGGVDSFFTLLRPRPDPARRPTHLLYLVGIEQPLGRSRGTDVVTGAVEEVARRTGTTLIPGQSNIRDLFTLNYELYYNGAALLAAALPLTGGLGTVLVPSTFSYGQLQPWGSHPILDPLWETEALAVVHDGCEALRVEKIEALLGEPTALEGLRVCLDNDGGPSNCGRCRKCVRTMLALDILDALPRAKGFPAALPADVDRLFGEDNEAFRGELLDFARRVGRRPDLTTRLERASRSARRRAALRTVMETTPGLAQALPFARRVRRAVRGPS